MASDIREAWGQADLVKSAVEINIPMIRIGGQCHTNQSRELHQLVDGKAGHRHELHLTLGWSIELVDG